MLYNTKAYRARLKARPRPPYRPERQPEASNYHSGASPGLALLIGPHSEVVKELRFARQHLVSGDDVVAIPYVYGQTAGQRETMVSLDRDKSRAFLLVEACKHSALVLHPDTIQALRPVAAFDVVRWLADEQRRNGKLLLVFLTKREYVEALVPLGGPVYWATGPQLLLPAQYEAAMAAMASPIAPSQNQPLTPSGQAQQLAQP